MGQNKKFLKTVCNLAVPVALQSMLQASFSIVDQIMIGQLGSVAVAGVGLAGKFSSIYSVLVSAIGAVAGIMISQYMGQENKKEIRRSFLVNFLLAIGIAVIFTVICMVFPKQIMGLYTAETDTQNVAGQYLFLIAGTFLMLAGTTMFSTMFRCMEKATLPLMASIVAACMNTGLNYLLIFGKIGFPKMGVKGAAIATVVSQAVNLLILLVLFVRYKNCLTDGDKSEEVGAFHWKQYGKMLLPVLVCELVWSLGENVYAVIYGQLGTDACAAMTLINPIQSLMIGALCGLSQAASVIVGKKLGNQEFDEAYAASKKLLMYGFAGSVVLSVVIVMTSAFYVNIYQVEEPVKLLTQQILFAYAIVAPFKVQNMILGGGIIRSGGKTKYVMMIDMIGTWMFGVPLGVWAAFILNLSIPYVYFILSLEECVRFAISLVVLRKKKWMHSLD